MQILYISALSSERLIQSIYEKTGTNPGFAVQKFSRLLVKGLDANGCQTIAFTNPPVVRGVTSKLLVCLGKEEEKGVKYKYIPFINLPILKHLCVMFYSFFYVLFWGLRNRKEKAIVCDVLSVSACMGALLATKLNRIQSVGVVTDIYGQMVASEKSMFASFVSRCANAIHDVYIKNFNKYILLTEAMTHLVNPKKRPFMVMEALCDSELSKEPFKPLQKVQPRTVIYAGGLFEKYGLKMLVEGFIQANVDNAKLVLYGDGPYVKELKEVCKKYSQVEYRGVAPNEVVMTEELKASLLVNPRFSTEELTKYSFPSKNMEFMASGTPLLTTKLPGMPKEYHPYVFLFEEETIEGYAAAISKVLSRSEHDLIEFGKKGREFVLNQKNNIFQGKRICNFINPN
ncbi:glycosyl transferase group 1 [gut metagenome]|uniref:Glycosyl transferase group 1 n=1 Tax=gut metagenome TaxID=749906 RepID=J9GF80_9ZZZZ